MSTNTDVDAIFDLATPATTSTDTDTPAPATATTSATAEASAPEGTANGPSSDAAATNPANPGAVYPNVLRTYKQSEIKEGENPEGTLTIAEFAGHLTFENLTKKGQGLEGIVKDQNIYTGVKAKKALPVVLVFADDADQHDQRNAKVYLPVKEATEAYENRPARGEGGAAAASKRDKDTLVTGLAKKTMELAKIEERLARTQEQRAKASATVQKYHGWLAEHFKGIAPVEVTETAEDGTQSTRMQTQDEANAAALRAEVEMRMDELALEEDNAKNSDIPDADKK